MAHIDTFYINNLLWCIPLTLLFWMLNWLDYYFTRRGLKKGKGELNPIIKGIGLLPVKILTTLLFPVIGVYTTKWFLVAASILLLPIGIWNFIQLKRR